MPDVRFYFNKIHQDHLKYCIERDKFNQYILASSINQKIEDYWIILDNAITISSILDSRSKISLFELGKLTTKAINTLHSQFSFYNSQKPQSQTSLSKGNTT